MTTHNSGWVWLPAILLALAAFAGPASVRAEGANQVDLAATLNYVKDWAARDAFPDSPSFAYQSLYCQLALRGHVNAEDSARIVEYLKKSQRADGGFVSNPDLNEPSNLVFSYFAIAALDLVDATSAIDREKAIDFVLSLRQKDGGIKGSARDATANLGTTYFGIRSLDLLKALDRIDKDLTIAWIKSHRDGDRGFGVLPGKPSATQATYMAVDALRVLGGLSADMKPGVLAFIKSTAYSGLGKPENPALMSMDETAYTLLTADIFSALDQLNLEKIHDFVTSRYIPENGGFGPSEGLGATPPSTYYAIVSLAKLGKLKSP